VRQISPRRRFHPAPDITARQIDPQTSPRPRYHRAPDCTQPQTSPRPRFQPEPDFTPSQISPFPRLHPAADFAPPQIPPPANFTPPQISRRLRFHGHTGCPLCQSGGLCRPTVSAESQQSRRAPRFLHPAENAPAQKIGPRAENTRKLAPAQKIPKYWYFLRGG